MDEAHLLEKWYPIGTLNLYSLTTTIVVKREYLDQMQNLLSKSDNSRAGHIGFETG